MKVMQKILTLILAILTLNPMALAQESQSPQSLQKICEQNFLESIPIQQGGRIKPLLVHTEESIKLLIGSKSFEGKSATHLYCLLSFSQPVELQTKIEHVKVQELLHLTQDSLPLTQLVDLQETIRTELMQTKSKDSYQKELEKLLMKIELYQEVKAGLNWFIPDNSTQPLQWVTLTQFLEGKQQSKALLLQSLQEAKQSFIQQEGDHYLLELTYTKMHLFSWAMVLVLLSLASLILFRQKKVGLVMAIFCALFQVAAITMRVMISGRAPITNMYETVMFSGFGGLILSILLTTVRQEKFFLMAGLSYNLLCLLMLNFAHTMLNGSIGPLVPVLRDNFWLSTHVTMVILSYAALALSWVLANMVLLKKRFSPAEKLTQQDLLYYNSLIYSCLKFGVVFLSGGVILGGVWADYSWGRFWGWDPKETWSLIVLLIYMIILHGKSTSWISPHRFLYFTAGAFMSVMMAWFGVNYILSSGLHSYGFSQGGAIFLACFFLGQILILAVTAKPFFKQSLT